MSPEDCARKIARAVHRLVARPDNLRDFRRQVETFKQEAADRKQQEKQAEQVLQKAARAIEEARKAVRASKAKHRLTNRKRAPGKGWQWMSGFSDPHALERVEGWFPPKALEAETFLCEAWNRRLYGPGSNPSLATMFTLLAALHDLCLLHNTAILDPRAGRPLTLAKADEEDLWALYSARLWCIRAKEGDTERLDALQGYLDEVREMFAARAASGARRHAVATKGRYGMSENAGQGAPQDRARQIVLDVDHLFRKNPPLWTQRWAEAVQEAHEWYEKQRQAHKRRQDVLDNVWREVRDVEARRAQPRLTKCNEKGEGIGRPGQGWRSEWVEISDPANRSRVQNVLAWMPPDAPDPAGGAWPGSDPSLAAMYLALAVLHDAILADGPKVLDSVTADSGAVGYIEGKNFDDGTEYWSIQGIPDLDDWRYSDQGIDRLEAYLNAVRKDPALVESHTTAEAGGPGAAAVPTPDPPGKEVSALAAPCPVVLGGADDPPIVCDREKEPLGVTAYNVVKALVEAYPHGLVKALLERKADCADPHKVLARLRTKDADWEAVIFMPGCAGRGGYRLKPV